jgi:3-hydroxyisobutyrate dehydrogenase
MMNIGIAGIGKMGSAIAARLHQLGHQVTIWNRSKPRAQALLDAGLQWVPTPQALAQRCELVLSLLTDEQALDDVYLGTHGLLSSPSDNTLFIEMSTVTPGKHEQLSQAATAAGAAYLECPVSGSVGPAKEGKLIGFAGGDATQLQRARPVLEQLCRRLEHVGPIGSGALMKLTVNLPLMVYWQTLGEALSLTEHLGLDPRQVIDVLSESSGGPNMLKVRGPSIAQTLTGTPNEQVTVNVATMRKDLQAMVNQAGLLGKQVPLTQATLDSFNQAIAQGLGPADCTQLPVWWLQTGAKA